MAQRKHAKAAQASTFVHETNADTVLKNAREHIASVWRGDFHNAKQVLAAMKKRLHKNSTRAADADIQAAFHRHRMQQAQQSRLLGMLAVEERHGFNPRFAARTRCARRAERCVWAGQTIRPFLLPLNQLLGFIGAHEWHKKGVDIPALGGKIRVPFGRVFPLRGEYLDLLMQAPLPESLPTRIRYRAPAAACSPPCSPARGMPAHHRRRHQPARHRLPPAPICNGWGWKDQVQIEAVDLFPAARADLIVCNPPWLPAKPTSAIEAALYDPGSAMLRKAVLRRCRRPPRAPAAKPG